MANPMQDAPILQDRLPLVPWADPRTRRLPGIQPVEGRDWLRLDEAYAGQMALRDRLIAGQPEVVHGLLPKARPAADELYGILLDWLRAEPGFVVAADAVTRPDGVTVPLSPDAPLLTLGRLVQQDLCLMESNGSEYDLTGAILCFPASWTLGQKIGRPMTGIHRPVRHYDEDVARRVQRLFDLVRVGQPLERYNALVYDDPVLHNPRQEFDTRPYAVERLYMRSERQCILRLPGTGAVVFSIHTHLVPMARFSEAERAAMVAAGL